MLLVSLASDFLVSIENHNSEGKERKINKGGRRTEKAIGHFLKNSRRGGSPFSTGRLRPEVQPLTLYISSLTEKVLLSYSVH